MKQTCKLTAVLGLLAASLMPAEAASRYWDGNGTADGAGTAPAGTWGTSAFWSTAADGTATPTTWTAGDTAVFSAGSDATGDFTVTISSAVSAANITNEEGNVTFVGPSGVNIGAGTVTINSGATLTTDTSSRIAASTGAKMIINGGRARVTNTGAAGSFVDVDMTISLNGGGTFDYTTPNVLNIIQSGVVVSGTGPFIKTGAGVLAIASPCTYSGATAVNAGELRIRTSSNRLPTGTDAIVNSPGILNLNAVSQQIGSLQGDGDVGLAGATLTIGGSSNTVYSGSIKTTANAGASPSTATGGNVTRQGAGILTLTGNNAFTGLLTMSAGGINVASGGFLCDPVCDVTLTGGVLALTNSAQTVENLFGTGGTIFLGQDHVLTINPVNSSRSTIYNGAVAGPGGITKIGASASESLLGVNTYSGPTTVSAGKLVLSTTSSGAGNFNVADSATLGAKAITTGNTLAMNNLGLGASTLEFDYGSLGTLSTRMASVAGTFDVTGSTLVNAKGFEGKPGPATLLEYVPASRAGAGTLSLGTLPPRASAEFNDDTVAGKVTLNVTNNDSLIYVGDASALWDINNAPNQIWKLASDNSATEYQETSVQGDTVLFDDSATGSRNINLSVAVSPFITVNNSAGAYAIAGAGKISGSGTLTKNGTDVLLLGTANDYAGGTILNGGTLAVTNNSALGTGKLTINGGKMRADTTARTLTVPVDLNGDATLGDPTENGTLTFSTGPWTITGNSRQITVDTSVGSISSVIGQDANPRALTKAGSGTLTLSGANTFTGGFNHTAGAVRVGNNAALGAANSPVNYSDGVTIATSSGTARTLTYAHTLGGNLTVGLAASGNATLTLAGTMDLGGSVRTLTTDTNCTISAIVNNGGITKAGAQTLTLSGANTYSGNTTVNQGILSLTAVSSVSGTYTLNTGGTLQLNTTASLGNGSGTLNLTGGRILTTGGRAAVPIPNPVVMTADTIFEGNTSGAGLRDLPFSGPFTTSAGTLTLKNDGTTTGFLNLRMQMGGLNFTQPVILGVAGDSGQTRLTAYNTNGSVEQVYSGEISGNGGFYRAAATAGTGGTAKITAANTYSGGTVVDDGILLVNNTSGSGTGSGSITVNTNGTLGGIGFIGGAVTNIGGLIAPGESIGTLTLAGGLDLSAGGIYEWQLGALSEASGFDQLVLSGGDLVLGGSSALSIKFGPPATSPEAGDPFWSSARSWKVVSLAGGSNPASLNFSSVLNKVYSNGMFTSSVAGDGIVLNFTPMSIAKPEFTSFSGAGTGNVQIGFTAAVSGATYTVQYKDSLSATSWTTLASVLGDGNPAVINDTTSPSPAQRFYRIIIQ